MLLGFVPLSARLVEVGLQSRHTSLHSNADNIRILHCNVVESVRCEGSWFLDPESGSEKLLQLIFFLLLESVRSVL